MESKQIKYCSGYKYQLVEDANFDTPYRPKDDIETEYIILKKDGYLTVKQGYAWDGPSGPTYDRSTNMRGSLVHDALYQLTREGFLPIEERDKADDVLLRCWKEDGMYGWLARMEVHAVRHFARSAAQWGAEHKIITSPPENP